MKYEKHVVRITKGKDFIMIDLLSPDSKTATSTEPLGAIVLSKSQWKELKNFIEGNPWFEEDLAEADQSKTPSLEKED
jgi:hypothetical protein